MNIHEKQYLPKTKSYLVSVELSSIGKMKSFKQNLTIITVLNISNFL
ncbi:hypothetical protein AVDCRST_MAG92-2676 [uncultured Coleofasciculus sp.]|uniref:Uncharacterized protein n=1 Tax=uncultured Coleofasciculus sp. TaxID=1267456 RepID=A0A6J4IXZ0_9CYAN|nr:hypothetical protein AVDCRST_MAG92-2676 [uncultured Coleofasciculus sp.]